MIVEVLSKDVNSLLNDKEIKAEFVEFYQKLFTKKVGKRYLPNILDWSSLFPPPKGIF